MNLLLIYVSCILCIWNESLAFSVNARRRRNQISNPCGLDKCVDLSQKPNRISKSEFSRQTRVSKSIAIAFSVVIFTERVRINSCIQSFYFDVLKKSQFFNHYSFEPLFASFIFAINMVLH